MERTKEENYIGVIIEDKLSFDHHITEKSKANSILGVISRSFEHLDIKIFRLLYARLIKPHLESANAVWIPYKKKQLSRAIESIICLYPVFISSLLTSTLSSFSQCHAFISHYNSFTFILTHPAHNTQS